MFKFLLNAAVVSTAFSGIRRTTGVNLGKMITNKMPHSSLQTASGAYFKMGDYIIDGTAKQWNNVMGTAPPKIEAKTKTKTESPDLKKTK